MTRTTIPYHTGDISSLARTLRTQLLERDGVPGHVELLNILARAIGRRNFQQLRAETRDGVVAQPAAGPLKDVAPPLDAKRLDRVRRCFSADGRLARWPARREDQVLALWGLWAKIPSRRDFTEQEISQVLRDLHEFGDHALLRRELFETRLVSRTPDCRAYRRIEQQPPPEVMELLRQIQAD